MNNEFQLVFKESDISYTKDKISINNFDVLKDQLKDISQYIRNSEVTEETVKDVKKILANANKTIDIVDSIKKHIKRDVMKPYMYFENQVKELLSEIKNAEQEARVKVRTLEEIERSEKKDNIKSLFDKRNNSIYQISWLNSEKFLRNEHLNKTYSMKKIEEEIVAFFERVKNDLAVLEKMENNQLLLLNYQEKPNLAAVLQQYQAQKEAKATEAPKLPCKLSIIITQQNVLKEIKNVLKEHLIDFEIEEI